MGYYFCFFNQNVAQLFTVMGADLVILIFISTFATVWLESQSINTSKPNKDYETCN